MKDKGSVRFVATTYVGVTTHIEVQLNLASRFGRAGLRWATAPGIILAAMQYRTLGRKQLRTVVGRGDNPRLRYLAHAFPYHALHVLFCLVSFVLTVAVRTVGPFDCIFRAKVCLLVIGERLIPTGIGLQIERGRA